MITVPTRRSFRTIHEIRTHLTPVQCVNKNGKLNSIEKTVKVKNKIMLILFFFKRFMIILFDILHVIHVNNVAVQPFSFVLIA